MNKSMLLLLITCGSIQCCWAQDAIALEQKIAYEIAQFYKNIPNKLQLNATRIERICRSMLTPEKKVCERLGSVTLVRAIEAIAQMLKEKSSTYIKLTHNKYFRYIWEKNYPGTYVAKALASMEKYGEVRLTEREAIEGLAYMGFEIRDPAKYEAMKQEVSSILKKRKELIKKVHKAVDKNTLTQEKDEKYLRKICKLNQRVYKLDENIASEILFDSLAPRYVVKNKISDEFQNNFYSNHELYKIKKEKLFEQYKDWSHVPNASKDFIEAYLARIASSIILQDWLLVKNNT